MKKRILALTLVLALSLLPACGKTAEPAATPAGTDAPAETAAAPETGRAAANEINIGIAQDFDSLDPHTMNAAGTKEIMFNVFEGLVKPNSDGEIVPAVASEIIKSEDGLTYTFTLRQGVKFHNGDPVTMQDLVFSIERRWNSDDAAAILTALSVIDHLDHDDSTLTITLSEPSNEFLAAVMNVYIIPAGYDKQATEPIGTGPYKFVSRTVQDSLVLERFADYWGTPGNIDKGYLQDPGKCGRAGTRPAERCARSRCPYEQRPDRAALFRRLQHSGRQHEPCAGALSQQCRKAV